MVSSRLSFAADCHDLGRGVTPSFGVVRGFWRERRRRHFDLVTNGPLAPWKTIGCIVHQKLRSKADEQARQV
jgi:hypothetical protein